MQKTIVTPYIESSSKSIIRISKQTDKILYDIFNKNIDTVLQKLGANAYTRTVRQLLSKDKIFLGYSLSNIHESKDIPVYGIIVAGNQILHAIVVDIIKCSPDSADDLIKIIKEMNNLAKEYTQLTRKLDDHSMQRAADIKNKMQKNQETIANLLDYERIIEAIYFNFIRYLVKEIDKGHSHKLFEYSINLFKSLIQKAFGEYMKIEDPKVYNAAIDYLFTKAMTNFSHAEIMANLKRNYPEQVIDVLLKIRINNFDSLSQTADMLRLLRIANITPIAFNNTFAKLIGEKGVIVLYSTYDIYVAWSILILHNSLLFDSITIDKELQSEIEKIILNYKSSAKF